MSKPKRVGLLSMCKKVAPSDMNKIAALANRAKGDRTNAAFAEACGVNAATMSRIINAKFKKGVSDDIICAIAVNAVNSSTSFFRELLDAQGLVIPAAEEKSDEEKEKLYTEYFNQVRSAWDMSTKTRTDQPTIPSTRKDNIRIRIREIVQNYLIEKGYMVAIDRDADGMERIPMDFNWTPDFVLKTNALESEGLKEWFFYISENAGQNFMRDFENLLGEAYFSKPAQDGYRITLVTTDRDNFYICREQIKGLGTAYDSFSILLVDTRYNLVKAEYVIDREGVETAKIMPYGEEEVDWQEIYGVPDDI